MSKKKYKVFVEGNNFLICTEGVFEKLGFFTTRFVEANDKCEAEELALNLIREELKKTILNDQSDPPIMYIESIDELVSFDDCLVPGSGFSWYPEDENASFYTEH